MCLNQLIFHCSGVSGEGSGVTVEGCAPITEEAIATPPVGDTKASTLYHIYGVYMHIFLSSQLFSPLSPFGHYFYPASLLLS